jgi:hypothetical protein
VGWLGATLGAVLLTALASSCAAISGLDGYSQGDCLVDCDAIADRSVLSQRPKDAEPESDTQGGDEPASDVDAAASDAATRDDAGDAQSQGPPDGGGEGGVDAEGEGGCGPLDTPANCSACGLACSTGTGSPSCNGSTCSYACNAGRSDCNASIAPDTDGCECAGTGCCSGKCQTAHSNGESGSFYDCTTTKTYNQTQAGEACAALTGTSGACSSSSVGCNCFLLSCRSQAQSVCGSSGGKCYCWQYSGPNAGTAQETNGSNCSASCGSGSDPAWN